MSERSGRVGRVVVAVLAAMTLAGSATAAPADVAPPPVTTLSGVVLALGTGAPVAGVTVAADTYRDGGSTDRQETTTAADGSFTLTLAYDGVYLVHFAPDSHWLLPDDAAAWDTPFVPGDAPVSVTAGSDVACSVEAVPTSSWTKQLDRFGMPRWTGAHSSFMCGGDGTHWEYAAVERFWSPGFGNAHFFTGDATEARGLIAGDRNWVYEGTAFRAQLASDDTCGEGSPVYRFYSPLYRSHFYTDSTAEKEHLVAADPAWSFEKVAFCAYHTPLPGLVPVHRFWSPRFGKHFFTANEVEKNHIVAGDRNWSYEGIAFYVVAP